MRTTLLAFVATVLAGACAPNVWSEPYPVYPVVLPRDDAARSGQATRGMVVRAWRARLGGAEAPAPYWHFFATEWNKGRRLSVLLGPPPGVAELLPGDYVDCVVEWVVQPLAAELYYGEDERFRGILGRHANSWQPVWHAAADFQPALEDDCGRRFAGVPVEYPVCRDTAEAVVRFRNTQGSAPVRFSGLPGPFGSVLEVEREPGKFTPWQPGAGGAPFWQTDYDPVSRTWAHTYSLPAAPDGRRYRFTTPRTKE